MVSRVCHKATDGVQRKKSLTVAAALRCGLLCKDCNSGVCRDLAPKQFECVSCYGKGCEMCNDTGRFETSECPQQIARPMVAAVEMFDMADKGHLPVSGGVLDQSAWFIEAYRFYSADVERARAKATK